MEEGIHIALRAEKIAEVFGLPITNSMLMSWIVMATLCVVAYFVGKNIQKIPNKCQTFFEIIFSFLLDYMEEVLESRELAKRVFPFITTLFIFILIGNWFGLVPGIGSLYIKEPIIFEAQNVHADELLQTAPDFAVEGVSDTEEVVIVDESHNTKDKTEHVTDEHSEHTATHIALLHPMSVDLNVTLALAIVAFLAIEISGVLYLGAGTYVSKFINFSSPTKFLVGIIELVSEFIRIVSFSFRLFGNMFAGKTLILVAIFLVPYILPIPLMAYEVFVGFIQAAIFAMLTLFFIKLAISEAH